MPSFLVTLGYGNFDRAFVVENVPSAGAAISNVYNIIGYNPGVPIKVKKLPVRETPNTIGNPNGKAAS